MNLAYTLVGAVVLALVVVDVLWTTLWVDGGGGPVSGRLSTWLWRGSRAASGDHPTVLSLAGPIILTTTLATWIGLIWLGWTLVFAGDVAALVSTRTGHPADWAGRFWYIAYTMFTTGNGDYTPTADRWELASSFTTATGMAFVTLGVSYVLTVLGAVSEKRSFASSVTGLGERGESFLLAAWDDGDFEGLDLTLESLSGELATLADQHEAYPILHYYHSENPDRAAARGAAILDEALFLARHGVAPEARPTGPALESASASVESYLATLDAAFIDPAMEVPPAPDLERLEAAGVPTVPAAAFADALDEREERRRRLLAVVRADAWEWPAEAE